MENSESDGRFWGRQNIYTGDTEWKHLYPVCTIYPTGLADGQRPPLR